MRQACLSCRPRSSSYYPLHLHISSLALSLDVLFAYQSFSAESARRQLADLAPFSPPPCLCGHRAVSLAGLASVQEQCTPDWSDMIGVRVNGFST